MRLIPTIFAAVTRRVCSPSSARQITPRLKRIGDHVTDIPDAAYFAATSEALTKAPPKRTRWCAMQ